MRGLRIYKELEKLCIELRDIPYSYIWYEGEEIKLSERFSSIINYIRKNGLKTEDVEKYEKHFANEFKIKESYVFELYTRLRNILLKKELKFKENKQDIIITTKCTVYKLEEVPNYILLNK